MTAASASPLPAAALERAHTAAAVEGTLAELPPGAQADVVAVAGDGPVSLRLRDLGFVAGTRVGCIKRAPLGDPAVYELRGTRLCLRDSESARVRVRRV